MKKYIPLLLALLVFAAPVFGLSILLPTQGGTGTSTIPTYGKVLVGNAGGTYTLTATSSLGISGGSGTPAGSAGQLQYNATGAFGGVATTTVTAGTGMSFTTFTAIGSSPITLNATGVASNALGTTSPWTVGQMVYVNGQGTVTSAATTTLTGTAPIVFSNPISVIGSTPSAITCTSASAGVTGCLTGTDWSTFNNKGSGSVTSVGLSSTNSTLTIGSTPVTGSGTITADLNLGHINTWSAVQNFGAGLVSQASSTFTGNTNGASALTINATATSSVSLSGAGLLKIDMSTFDGTALGIVASSSASNNGRLMFLNNTSYLNPQNLFLASSTAANSTVMNLKGWATGQGVLKCEHTGSGTGFSNGSCISIDTANDDAQPLFIKVGTGNALTVNDAASNTLFTMGNDGSLNSKRGYQSFGTTTTASNYAQTTIASSTAPQVSLSQGAGVAQIVLRAEGSTLAIASTTSAGTATTTPSALEINTNALPSIISGTTTPATNMALVLGNNNGTSAVGTTTIKMAKLQYEFYNSGNALTCGYVSSANAWVFSSGACANN